MGIEAWELVLPLGSWSLEPGTSRRSRAWSLTANRRWAALIRTRGSLGLQTGTLGAESDPHGPSESSPESYGQSSRQDKPKGAGQRVGRSVPDRPTHRIGQGSILRFPHRSREGSSRNQEPRTPVDSPSGSSDGFLQGGFPGETRGFLGDCPRVGTVHSGLPYLCSTSFSVAR